MRRTCGAGWFCKGMRSLLRMGKPLTGSSSPSPSSQSILKVPLAKLRMALTQASLVEYTKLPSIQDVILLICEEMCIGEEMGEKAKRFRGCFTRDKQVFSSNQDHYAKKRKIEIVCFRRRK